MTMEPKDVLDAVSASCAKNKLSAKETEVAVNWANQVLTNHGVLENLVIGNFEIVSVNGQEPGFRLTEQGKDMADGLLGMQGLTE